MAGALGTDLGGKKFLIPQSTPLTLTPVGWRNPLRDRFKLSSLSERLAIPANIDYEIGEELASVTMSMSSGVVLVSWEHKAITGRLLPSTPAD